MKPAKTLRIALLAAVTAAFASCADSLESRLDGTWRSSMTQTAPDGVPVVGTMTLTLSDSTHDAMLTFSADAVATMLDSYSFRGKWCVADDAICLDLDGKSLESHIERMSATADSLRRLDSDQSGMLAKVAAEQDRLDAMIKAAGTRMTLPVKELTDSTLTVADNGTKIKFIKIR